MNFKSMPSAFLSYAYIAFVGMSSAILFLVAALIKVLTHFFDRRLVLLNLFSSFWASLYIWCMPLWSVKISGRGKMDMAKSYILVSNHQSQLDILVAYRLFFPFRWVSKAEVFKLPFIGWNMGLNNYVKLKRGDSKSVRQMMDQCESLLEQGNSIIMFPEGTRSKTGLVKPFKHGAFILAKKMKKPILPLVINNTKDALPKHSLHIQGKYLMTVTVLDEIPYSTFKDMDVESVCEMVRQKIIDHVKEHQAQQSYSDSQKLFLKKSYKKRIT